MTTESGTSRVTVGGRLLADPAGLVTVEPRERHDQLTTSATGAIAPRSGHSLPLAGIDATDVATLPGARRDATHVQAWADLTAVLAPNGTAHVERYDPLSVLTDFWTPAPSTVLEADVPPPPDEPPTPEPRTAVEQDLIDSGVIVSRKVLRTRHRGRVLVIATTAPAQVERHLRPVYGGHLHVHASRWTAEQYRSATDTLNDHFDRWQLLIVGDHVNGQGEVVVVAATVTEHPELATWLAEQPPGLVDHRPWLRHVR